METRMPRPDPPQVAVLSLGGTVAMTTVDDAGARPRVGAAELVSAVPELEERARVTTLALSSVPSASLRLMDLLGFFTKMESVCDEGAQGVVLTTGTDTLEEVAYLFDLFWCREQPVVVTGAMRTADAPGTDGPSNLLGAVTVAASPEARGRGCLVVINDDVHTGRAVRKAHTTRLDAFTSVGGSSVGRVHEGRALLRPALPRQHVLRMPSQARNVPKVALIRLTLDQDVDLFEHAAQTHDGVVVEVFGAGHIPAWWVDAVERATRRVPVVVTSRTGDGALLRDSYGFRGSERDLVNAGVHVLDELDGVKARILLIAALLTASDRKEVDEIMTSATPSTALADRRGES